MHWRGKQDIVIVIGPTGVGKSTFVESVTGNQDVGIEHGLDSGELLKPFILQDRVLTQSRTARHQEL